MFSNACVTTHFKPQNVYFILNLKLGFDFKSLGLGFIVETRAGSRACFKLLKRLWRAARWCLVSRSSSGRVLGSNTLNKTYRKAPANVITMNVSGGIVRIRHLLIRRAFRETCIFTHNDYIKDFLFLFVSLSSNLKLSIDIYHVCEAFIRCLLVHFCEALLFTIKAQRFVDIVSSHK